MAETTILYAVLMALGFLTPQTMVSSDPGVHTGNGQWAPVAAVRFIPDRPEVLLVLNTSESVRNAWSELWMKKMFGIREVNRLIEAQLSGDSRKSREMKAVAEIGKQILALKPRGAAAGLYIDGAGRSVHIMAAADCDRMDAFTFFIKTSALFLQADNETVVREKGTWTYITTVKPVEKNLRIAAAVSRKAVLFEMALNAPLEKIDRIAEKDAPCVSDKGSFASGCVTARGDSSDILFFAVDTPELISDMKHIDTRPVKQFLTVFQPQEFGRIVYSVRPGEKGFTEHFSILGSSQKGLLVNLINCSEPIDSGILGLVPEDALYVQAGGFRFADALEVLTASLAQHEETARTGERIKDFFAGMAENGIDIKGNVIRPLQGTALLSVSLPEAGMPVPGTALIFRTDTPESVLEILELVQNEKFRLTKREIGGVPAYTVRLPRAPVVFTFGALNKGSDTYFAAASTPDTFLKIVQAASKADRVTFKTGTPLSIPEDTLFFQYCCSARLAVYGYTLFRNAVPLLGRKAPLLKGLNAGALPPADDLFGEMPDYTAFTTKRKGTVISTPFPGIRLVSALPALLAVRGAGFIRMINAQAIKAKEKELELKEMQKKMKEEDVELF